MSSITTSKEQRRPGRLGLDVQRLRADFPILEQLVHGKPLIYFDNAASTQKPRAVLDALRDYYEHDHANVHRAAHLLSERATKAYEEARLKVQKFLGAGCLREIVFTRGTTEAINLVAQTFGRMHVHAGDEVVVTALEHHSNIVPWQMLCQEKKANLRVVPVTDAGELRLDELEKMLGPQTKLVALAHVSNALGTINPVKEIIALAHRRGIPVLLDGAQAVSHLRVDVRDLDCDFYAFSGHKIFGPTGIGALYGKARHLELMPPYQTGGDMISHVSFEKTTWNELPYKFEAGTPNIAGAVGLGAALDYVEAIGLDAIAAHEKRLLEHATDRLRALPGVRLIGTAAHKAAVLSFVVDEPPLSALDIGTQLDLEGIAIRTGHHCCQPLMERYAIPGTARASFALYNTLEEVDVFARTLERIIAATRPRAVVGPSSADVSYAPASAASPQEAADELAEVFDFLDDWSDRYGHLIELGEKLPPLPAQLKTEANRVRGCQSTVYIDLRIRPGTADVVEFLADSDADIVRGLVAVLEQLYSGQRAAAIAAFDIEDFFRRIGLDRHLSMGRRNGLAEMAQRIRTFAVRKEISQ
jgi:cysteine desulfurase / selenocysteine lyase